ncbi:DUF6629 family protein, partial [Streptomyces sp. NPDC050095]|uniref:DUF6629 family protein n=1 Tax=Streptomyces sp. NPDC050095 TaxID=3155512 RepID=UPI003416881B
MVRCVSDHRPVVLLRAVPRAPDGRRPFRLAHALATTPVTAEIRGHTMGYAIGLPHAGWV